MSVSGEFPAGEDREVRIEGDLDAAVALVTVRGHWDLSLGQAVTTKLHKCLAEHPEALIVDLTGLRDPHSASAPIWISAQRAAAAREPAVQMALCIPPHLPLADKMQRLGIRRFMPVYARVRQARVAIAARLPLTERLSVTLPPDPDAPSLARILIGDACLAWGLPDLMHRSRLVISELVTNAVEHAGTPIVVEVSLRGRGVHLTVSDGVAAPPRLLEPVRPRPGRPLDERGLGMRTVRAAAAAWGWLPTRTGKVVWATVQGRLAEPPPTDC
ncbi:ATP-binding protein [Actinoplanes subtropicus]|uniref:ATP-binding protein n=1 Tax=Actinoplanes subtropicus TaxID=543632 RepID=UPI0006905342|nr:ATP-binding protein [Actinoplanes subtropicus]